MNGDVKAVLIIIYIIGIISVLLIFTSYIAIFTSYLTNIDSNEKSVEKVKDCVQAGMQWKYVPAQVIIGTTYSEPTWECVSK